MNPDLKVLVVDACSGFYRMERYRVGDFFGPVDLGLHLAGRYNSLNIGVGLLAGSILPGSNRLVITGFSPCWGGFFVSTMGGAGIVFDNLGINLLCIRGTAPRTAILRLNRSHAEEVDVRLAAVNLDAAWEAGRGGVYGLMDHALERYGADYREAPRILATGPAALATDFGALVSAPVENGKVSFVDTWAGRGGFGSKLLREHGIAAVVYGGTYIDEDFKDRRVADTWFEDRYRKRLAAKDLEATTKYRFDPAFNTGGTLGVNFAGAGGSLLAFNYRSIYLEEGRRLDMHQRFILDHYLRQFNEETIAPKHQHTCGEPCAAVCKKMRGEYKKDFEPYQAMGPLCGVFDQRAAELLTHHADRCGFDAISAGGVLAWLMECLAEGLLDPGDLGVTQRPAFSPDGFGVETDSMHNASIGTALLDAIIKREGILDLAEGARRLCRRISRDRGRGVLDCFLYTAFARKGWMVPNQYWTPGVLSPMAVMGKYYMHTGRSSSRPASSAEKMPSGSSTSSSWTTWVSAGSTAPGPRR